MKHNKMDMSEFEKKMQFKLSDPEEVCELWNKGLREDLKHNKIPHVKDFGLCVCAVFQTGCHAGIDELTQTWALTAKFHGLGIDV